MAKVNVRNDELIAVAVQVAETVAVYSIGQPHVIASINENRQQRSEISHFRILEI